MRYFWNVARPLRAGLFAVVLVTAVTVALADGTEVLGPPVGTELLPASGLAAGATGLATQPVDLQVDVPAGATVVQVWLYWSGRSTLPPGDDTLDVDGNAVTGDLVGGPAPPDGDALAATYRADITGLGLVAAGANSLSLAGLTNDVANDGAGVIVLYDDGGAADIQHRDGQDLAVPALATPYDTTVPVAFRVSPSPESRVGELSFAVSVQEPGVRGLSIQSGCARYVAGGGGEPSEDQPGWTIHSLTIVIPPMASNVILSVAPGPAGAQPFQPSAFALQLATLVVPEVPGGSIGDLVWNDRNGDGLRDEGEPGLYGVKVDLTCAGEDGELGTEDDLMRSRITDPRGHYLFAGLSADTCEVDVDESTLPDGAMLTTGNEPLLVVLNEDEHFDEADFGYLLPQGCSHGYWKNHPGAWDETSFRMMDTVESVFSEASVYPELGAASLMQALRFKGGSEAEGGARILLRQAVAAVLNADHPDVTFPWDVDEVVDAVNDALASGDRQQMLHLAGDLDDDNNLGCPLNGPRMMDDPRERTEFRRLPGFMVSPPEI